MSIRFHRGPSIVTLFHDSSSSTSRQVLQLLSSYNARRGTVHASPNPPQPTSASHGESDIVEAHNTPGDGGGGMEFLRQAAADLPDTLPIELEIVDRRTNPPTPDQMRSIIDYLASHPTSTSSPATPLSGEGGPTSSTEDKYTSSGFNLTEHERRQKALQPHLATTAETTGAGMPKIKDGPLVVNWDEGFATTSLEGVHQMLKRLQQSTPPEKASNSGGSCTIC